MRERVHFGVGCFVREAADDDGMRQDDWEVSKGHRLLEDIASSCTPASQLAVGVSQLLRGARGSCCHYTSHNAPSCACPCYVHSCFARITPSHLVQIQAHAFTRPLPRHVPHFAMAEQAGKPNVMLLRLRVLA